MAFIVVDFQGFPLPDKSFAIKELAIVDVTSNFETQYLAKPPCPLSNFCDRHCNTIRYVHQNIHGIPWKAGYMELADVECELKIAVLAANKVYIKGLDRLNFVLMLTSCNPHKLIDLDQFEGIPRTIERNKSFVCNYRCANHDRLRCAMEQAIRFRDFLRRNVYFHNAERVNIIC